VCHFLQFQTGDTAYLRGKADDGRQSQEATEAEGVHMFAEELAEQLRSQWKQHLDSDLRDRARRASFDEEPCL